MISRDVLLAQAKRAFYMAYGEAHAEELLRSIEVLTHETTELRATLEDPQRKTLVLSPVPVSNLLPDHEWVHPIVVHGGAALVSRVSLHMQDRGLLTDAQRDAAKVLSVGLFVDLHLIKAQGKKP